MLGVAPTSLALASVGAAVACAAVLLWARDRARLALSLAPLAVGAAAVLDPGALSLLAWGLDAGALGEPLSVTLRYETAEGLKAVSAPLAAASPLAAPAAWGLAALGLAGLGAELAGAARASRAALGLWAALAVAALLAGPLTPLAAAAGEAGVREWLALGVDVTGVDAQRVSALAPPAGEWRWAPARGLAGLVALGAALLGALLPASASARDVGAYGDAARRGVTAGAALALLGLAAQLGVSGGLTASAAPLLAAAAALGVAAALAHRGAQALTLSVCALLSLAAL